MSGRENGAVTGRCCRLHSLSICYCRKTGSWKTGRNRNVEANWNHEFVPITFQMIISSPFPSYLFYSQMCYFPLSPLRGFPAVVGSVCVGFFWWQRATILSQDSKDTKRKWKQIRRRGEMRERACSQFYVSFFMDAWWFGCGVFFFYCISFAAQCL